MEIKEQLEQIELSPMEHNFFVKMCSGWAYYCDKLSRMNREEVLMLLKYLTDERPSAKNLLHRAISRFNKVNQLRKEDLE